MFAVITGPNGSGKTQLLELIYNTIISSPLNKARITIKGESYASGEVSFLRSEWVLNNTAPMNLMRIQQDLPQLYQQFTRVQHHSQSPKLEYLMNETSRKIGKPRGAQVTLEEFELNFPVEYLEDETHVTNQISRIFIDYNISRIEELAKGKTAEQVIEQIGPSPWVLLNEIMQEANLPFS